MKSRFRFILFLFPVAIAAEAHEPSPAPSSSSRRSLPWVRAEDVPLPVGAAGVFIRLPDQPASPQQGPAVYTAPGDLTRRRGTLLFGETFPLFAAVSGPNCSGRWLSIAPHAWTCSDHTELTKNEAWSTPSSAALPYRYYFAAAEGARGYDTPELVGEGVPSQEFEKGFGVGIVDEKRLNDRKVVRTAYGRWIDTRELVPANPSRFHGEAAPKAESKETHAKKIGWFREARTLTLKGTKTFYAKRQAVLIGRSEGSAKNMKFEIEDVGGKDANVKDPNGKELSVKQALANPTWVPASWLAIPSDAPMPTLLAADERWVDVDLATQILTAFEGNTPVFYTLVSTGRGGAPELSTPVGEHRVWAKLLSTKMDNLEDVEHAYSLEDVPYVQFFSKGVALHGAFWHDDFGKKRSHGCVNLSPEDARHLFEWSSPHLPKGMSAVLPTSSEPGLLVRVR